MTAYDPLHVPNPDPLPPGSVDGEIRLTREFLDSVADENIHDHTAMVRAAAGLDYRLRSLLAAVTSQQEATS